MLAFEKNTAHTAKEDYFEANVFLHFMTVIQQKLRFHCLLWGEGGLEPAWGKGRRWCLGRREGWRKGCWVRRFWK